MGFVYHLCSRDMRGTTLFPLNGLKDRYPDIYTRERKKYEGRESVLDWIVPGLGVRWADTVNLSGLDPRLLMAARVQLGVPFSRLLERPLARIPLERIAASPAVVYNSATHWINSSPGEEVPLLLRRRSSLSSTRRLTPSRAKFLSFISTTCCVRRPAASWRWASFSYGMCSSPARSICLESISSSWNRRLRAINRRREVHGFGTVRHCAQSPAVGTEYSGRRSSQSAVSITDATCVGIQKVWRTGTHPVRSRSQPGRVGRCRFVFGARQCELAEREPGLKSALGPRSVSRQDTA